MMSEPVVEYRTTPKRAGNNGARELRGVCSRRRDYGEDAAEGGPEPGPWEVGVANAVPYGPHQLHIFDKAGNPVCHVMTDVGGHPVAGHANAALLAAAPTLEEALAHTVEVLIKYAMEGGATPEEHEAIREGLSALTYARTGRRKR